MSENAPPQVAPEVIAYAVRDQIAELLPAALSLRKQYYAVQAGQLAPVYNIDRGQPNYYLSRIQSLGEEMDASVRRAGGLVIAHEAEELREDGSLDNIVAKETPITGSYFQTSTGALFGLVANSSATVEFTAKDIVVPDGSHDIGHLLYTPREEDVAIINEKYRQQELDRLRHQHRRTTTKLRRIK